MEKIKVKHVYMKYGHLFKLRSVQESGCFACYAILRQPPILQWQVLVNESRLLFFNHKLVLNAQVLPDP